jgi:hypothetical protein
MKSFTVGGRDALGQDQVCESLSQRRVIWHRRFDFELGDEPAYNEPVEACGVLRNGCEYTREALRRWAIVKCDRTHEGLEAVQERGQPF